MINNFRGQNFFLSNFYLCKVRFDGLEYKCVESAFQNSSKLKWMLKKTGAEELVEGNNWNDTYWGKCNGHGQNKLGIILMKVRSELLESE